MIKAFIINFNRLHWPSVIADWLGRRGCDPVFVDNASDYVPLLDYYAHTSYKVINLPQNYGHTVIWQPVFESFLKSMVGSKERYIVTDPDLDLSGIPDDWLEVLNEGLNRYRTFDKCGFSLEIRDLPSTEEGRRVREQFERKYWLLPLDEKYFDAPIDTTFALYREGARQYFHRAIRTNRPYTARHLPWYYNYDDLDSLPADERYYILHANQSCSGKARIKNLPQ